VKTRVIPVLLLEDGGLVKTVQFKNASYVGDPINAVRIFCGKEVDELTLLDIGATRTGSGPNFDVLNDIVSEAFMPVAYGGGITSVEQAARLFELGIEKIVLNSVLADTPRLVDELVARFGSQAIVASIDVSDRVFRSRQVAVLNGRKSIQRDPVEFAGEMQRRGAGEVLLTSIAKEGTGRGYDCQLISQVAVALEIPVVAHGGAGTLAHFAEAVAAGASAVAAGSMFVYHGPHRAVLVSYPERAVLEAILP
jgi:imidazole glycerol-phosphate synthase subunit HisF